ncbi:MAG: response regulator [Candidatus Woesearchaeota archaeon]
MSKKIMIVEDSNLMIAVIRKFILSENPDVTIIEARDGNEAVTKYEQEKPNLVFMDIKMPGMDGLEALEIIRGKDATAKVVMCTSLKEPEQEARANKAGAKGYIMKPFSRQDIVDAVKNNI